MTEGVEKQQRAIDQGLIIKKKIYQGTIGQQKVSDFTFANEKVQMIRQIGEKDYQG